MDDYSRYLYQIDQIHPKTNDIWVKILAKEAIKIMKKNYDSWKITKSDFENYFEKVKELMIAQNTDIVTINSQFEEARNYIIVSSIPTNLAKEVAVPTERLLPWTITVFQEKWLIKDWYLNIDKNKAKEILVKFSWDTDFFKKWKVTKDIIVLVLAVQFLLNEKYTTWLKLDWLLWTETQKAIKKFQRDNDLASDWVPWNKTVTILQNIN